MKIRGIAVVEFDFSGGFKEAAELQWKLENHIANFVNSNASAVNHEVEMRTYRPGSKGRFK